MKEHIKSSTNFLKSRAQILPLAQAAVTLLYTSTNNEIVERLVADQASVSLKDVESVLVGILADKLEDQELIAKSNIVEFLVSVETGVSDVLGGVGIEALGHGSFLSLFADWPRVMKQIDAVFCTKVNSLENADFGREGANDGLELADEGCLKCVSVEELRLSLTMNLRSLQQLQIEMVSNSSDHDNHSPLATLVEAERATCSEFGVTDFESLGHGSFLSVLEGSNRSNQRHTELAAAVARTLPSGRSIDEAQILSFLDSCHESLLDLHTRHQDRDSKSDLAEAVENFFHCGEGIAFTCSLFHHASFANTHFLCHVSPCRSG